MKKQHQRAALTAAGLITACLTLIAPLSPGQNSARPITASNFHEAAPRGFGDRNNTWAQSMIWWNNALYVGASRDYDCLSLFALWEVVSVSSPYIANTYLPYPPRDPDMSCAADGADLPLQAEIWRWTSSNNWQRVFQSPLALDNPNEPGKKLPYEYAIRDFATYTEPDGTQALYAFTVNTTIAYDRNKLPPPRILRSTDGITFTPVPQAPGTFLGDMPFTPDHSSLRAATSYNGKLFALCGPVFGQGSLIASANPSLGNDSWFLAGGSNPIYYELEVFNGWLYLGGFDPTNGYTVVKTHADGSPPYQFITVVPPGAGLSASASSKSVVSMHVYAGQLYVGTASFTEMIRINPDDTWDLVVGSPRSATNSNGVSTMKYPTSGLEAGFGLTLNDHAWQMDDPFRYLYVGTYNASTSPRFDPVYGPVLAPNMGAHLYRTQDAWYFNPITMNGFTNLGDSLGGKFDYGFRSMAYTPFGMFLGSVNDYYGFMIFQADTRGSSAPDPPGRLEMEPATNGNPLLSWNSVGGAKVYHVWRAELSLCLVRDNVNVEGWNLQYGNKIPDQCVGQYIDIADVSTTSFFDSTAQAGHKYMYYVTAEKTNSAPSDASNLVAFPLNTPPVTFGQLMDQVQVWNARGRFVSNGFSYTIQNITAAKQQAAACQINQAVVQLNAGIAQIAKVPLLLDPELTDANVLYSKLVRRLQLYSQFPQQITSTEFCTGH